MDLMTGTYDYEGLKRKYSNFKVPAAKLKIGGSELLSMKGVLLERIQVHLSLQTAGSAEIVLTSLYDYKNRSFDSSVKSKTVLGKEVEVELGYGSSTTMVFKGFLASVRVEFDVDDGITYHIMALDARRLMMSDNSHAVVYDVKNYSDAVKKVLKRYSKLCTAKVDATTDSLTAPVYQRGSDYDFIVNDLIGGGKTDREFFIVADKVYFRKPKSTSAPVLSLGIASGLKQFYREAFYLNQKVQVIGYQPDSKNEIKGEASAKAADSQVNALSETGVTVRISPECDTADKAKKKASALADELKDKSQNAGGTCIGLPELVPGRYLKVEKVDSLVNHKYYLKTVVHQYSQDGFSTSFEAGGWG